MSWASGVPYIISCNGFSSFRGAVHKEGVERTAPLCPRMTRTSGLGVQSMIKNSALLMVTFAMLAFCALGRAQEREPSIDSAIEVARANMHRQSHSHLRNDEPHDRMARPSGRSIGSTSANDACWTMAASPSSRSTPRSTRTSDSEAKATADECSTTTLVWRLEKEL